RLRSAGDGYRSTRYLLAQLDAAFGTLRLTDRSGFRIEAWKAPRRKVVAPATVNRELTVLKATLEKAVAWHLLDVYPAWAVRPFAADNARLPWFPPHELARFARRRRARHRRSVARSRHQGSPVTPTFPRASFFGCAGATSDGGNRTALPGTAKERKVAATAPWACQSYRLLPWFPAISSLRDTGGTPLTEA